LEPGILRERGQVSIEFLFVFMIALVYIHSVVQPSIDIASASIEDVSRVSQARLAAEKLANSVNELLVSDGQGKKTIHILVPENSSVSCDNSLPAIKFNVKLSDKLAGVNAAGCTNRDCTGSIRLVSQKISCEKSLLGKKFFAVELAKNAAGVVNVR